ncbi:hypothetical protein M9435_005014 [Picochlorum sp. BPE23]|nr:hypothetical protein M9435_005014 [Picochlorum sp. BPE23]
MRLWLFALGIICITTYSIFSSERRHVCLSKDEDFYLFYGDDIRHLKSIDAVGWEAGGVWPIANPMLFKNSVGSVDGYLSSPSLHVHKGVLYILFKVCSCKRMGCDVGVAKSTNEGHSWEYIGRAESLEPISGAMTSSRLSLFQSHETEYLTVSENGKITVYEFRKFPSSLKEGKKIQGVPAGFQHARVTWHQAWKQWMLLATKGPGFSWEQQSDEISDISVFFSKKNAMVGWKRVKVARPPSQMQPVADGGDMYIHNRTHSYRIVATCSAWGECSGLKLRRMYLHRIRDSKKLVYSERDVNEKSGGNVFARLSGPKGEVLRYASIARLPSGKVMMVGSSRKRPDYAMHLKLYLLQSLEYLCLAYYIALACCGAIVIASYISSGAKANMKKNKMNTRVGLAWSKMSKFHPLLVLGGVAALMCVALLLKYVLYYSRLHQPFYKESKPIAIAGKFSQFTLMTMSYSKRASLLDSFIQYYSQCPSVGSIIIVWNGEGVDSIRHLQTHSRKPPVSIRVEHKGSMNNRYRPDAHIGTRAVLILDDDLRIPCGSIEAAFAAWRREPHRLVGWYPRLVEVPQAAYHGEPETMASSKYNLILTGAAFIDHTTYFKKYWSKKYAKLRDLVDKKKNCDDILMNFVVASEHRGTKPVVQYLRPQRLIDLSHTTGVGISHDEKDFIRKAEACLKEFEKIFGNPLKTNTFPASSGFKRPVCNQARSKLFCSYPS